MNRATLRAMLLTDLHKSYSEADVNGYVARGEALIRSKLTAYGISVTLDDADRVEAESPIYTLPSDVLKPRQMRCNEIIIRQSDDTTVSMYRDSSVLSFYALGPDTVTFGGNPATGSEIIFDYFGQPPALTDAAGNTLSEKFPQLYFHAAAVYMLTRAQDYESTQLHMTSAQTILKDINTAMRRQLGRPEASPVYNTAFRSSY